LGITVAMNRKERDKPSNPCKVKETTIIRPVEKIRFPALPPGAVRRLMAMNERLSKW